MLNEVISPADVVWSPPDLMSQFLFEYWYIWLLFLALPAAVFTALFILNKSRKRRMSKDK